MVKCVRRVNMPENPAVTSDSLQDNIQSSFFKVHSSFKLMRIMNFLTVKQ